MRCKSETGTINPTTRSRVLEVYNIQFLINHYSYGSFGRRLLDIPMVSAFGVGIGIKYWFHSMQRSETRVL